MPEELLFREIPLSQGQVTLVDAEDFEWLNQWKWTARRCVKDGPFYAVRKTSRKDGKPVFIRMHRLILGLERADKRYGDHVSGDTLDNRRSNLRIATCTQNLRNSRKHKDNTSGFKGVTWSNGNRGWMARICVDRRHIWLGQFTTAELAHAAYCAAATKYHGEFARMS